MTKLLIVDDNEQISAILEQYALKEGYEVYIASDGVQALTFFDTYQPDAVLLDVMMPKKDGFEVCKDIRRHSQVPIIMITARGEDFEKIMGLDIGADDYIVKPFSPAEVMARLRAILRRMAILDEQKQQLLFDNLTINIEKYTVEINHEQVMLTKKEIEILWLLAKNQNKVFSRDQLLELLWGYDYFGDTRTVDSHIKRLRAKLDQFEHPLWHLKTIWGVGYKFEVKQDV